MAAHHTLNNGRTLSLPYWVYLLLGRVNYLVMGNFTQEKCIAAMAEMHPYTAKEISDVFERCGSIDKTIDVIYNSRRTKRTLMQTCEFMGL